MPGKDVMAVTNHSEADVASRVLTGHIRSNISLKRHNGGATAGHSGGIDSLREGRGGLGSIKAIDMRRYEEEGEDMVVTAYQERVYTLLKQIPAGRVTSYKALSDALGSSPRAVGGALRVNPFAPEVPCHRVIASTGYVGGFLGDWRDAPSGINCEKKLELLRGEGVEFDGKGVLADRGKWWGEFRI